MPSLPACISVLSLHVLKIKYPGLQPDERAIPLVGQLGICKSYNQNLTSLLNGRILSFCRPPAHMDAAAAAVAALGEGRRDEEAAHSWDATGDCGRWRGARYKQLTHAVSADYYVDLHGRVNVRICAAQAESLGRGTHAYNVELTHAVRADFANLLPCIEPESWCRLDLPLCARCHNAWSQKASNDRLCLLHAPRVSADSVSAALCHTIKVLGASFGRLGPLARAAACRSLLHSSALVFIRTQAVAAAVHERASCA